jgi:hypothetical protein
MTEMRQRVLDAYSANDNTPMTVNDLRNISHVGASVINTMIKRGLLTLTDTRTIESDEFNHKYFDTGNVVLNS